MSKPGTSHPNWLSFPGRNELKDRKLLARCRQGLAAGSVGVIITHEVGELIYVRTDGQSPPRLCLSRAGKPGNEQDPGTLSDPPWSQALHAPSGVIGGAAIAPGQPVTEQARELGIRGGCMNETERRWFRA